jgi:hypothetical protein
MERRACGHIASCASPVSGSYHVAGYDMEISRSCCEFCFNAHAFMPLAIACFGIHVHREAHTRYVSQPRRKMFIAVLRVFGSTSAYTSFATMFKA